MIKIEASMYVLKLSISKLLEKDDQKNKAENINI